MFEIGVRLQYNNSTVSLLYSAVASTWIDGFIKIQTAECNSGTVPPLHHNFLLEIGVC